MPETKITESLRGTAKIGGLPAVNIVRGDKVVDVDGCLVKITRNRRTLLRLKTFSECIDCQSKAPYYGVLKWQRESYTPAREVKFKIKKRIVESDGETAYYPVKLEKYLKNELLPEISAQTTIFKSNDSLSVITHRNEIIRATVDNIDHTAIQLKQSRLPKSLRKGCPIYDADMRLIGLVKDKKLGVIWNASWIKKSSGMYLEPLYRFRPSSHRRDFVTFPVILSHVVDAVCWAKSCSIFQALPANTLKFMSEFAWKSKEEFISLSIFFVIIYAK